jgi:hypothetical protein
MDDEAIANARIEVLLYRLRLSALIRKELPNNAQTSILEWLGRNAINREEQDCSSMLDAFIKSKDQRHGVFGKLPVGGRQRG